VFHSIELVEVTGKGKALRGDDGAAAARTGDPKLEYEASLFEIYGRLADKGPAQALERLEQTKANPLLAPLRAKLDRDAECLAFAQDARDAALAGAAKLADNRAFTFTRADGREVAVGNGSQSTVKSVAGTAINVEQKTDGGTAKVKLDYAELSPQTQQELLRLGVPAPSHAELKVAILTLARFSGSPSEALAREVRAHLDAARKDAALVEKADHLAGHLEFFQRNAEAQQRFQQIEVLCRQEKWRDAKAAIEQFRADYLNSFALERFAAALDRYSARIEKETASPLLKR
jgi:hypothetical protein